MIYVYIYLSLQAEKEEGERKRITFQSITFFAPLLAEMMAEMILFSWRSIKNIILLERRTRVVEFPFFLSFFFFFFFSLITFVIFVCLFVVVSAD